MENQMETFVSEFVRKVLAAWSVDGAQVQAR